MIELAAQYFALVASITRADIDEGKKADVDDYDNYSGLIYAEKWGGDWLETTPGCRYFVVDDVVDANGCDTADDVDDDYR